MNETRQIVAILAGDVVGSSRLAGEIRLDRPRKCEHREATNPISFIAYSGFASDCYFRGLDPERPLQVDCSRPVSANSGRSQTVRRTGQVDPELPYEIGPVNGREARESGLRLKASVAPVIVGRPTW
jgi:hypothetical protein